MLGEQNVAPDLGLVVCPIGQCTARQSQQSPPDTDEGFTAFDLDLAAARPIMASGDIGRPVRDRELRAVSAASGSLVVNHLAQPNQAVEVAVQSLGIDQLEECLHRCGQAQRYRASLLGKHGIFRSYVPSPRKQTGVAVLDR